MKGLRSILGDSVKEAGGKRRAEELGTLELWAEVVGKEIAEATRAERLRDGILFVVTKSSVWTHELTFFKEQAIQRLNDRLGRPLVRDIRFKTGPLLASPPRLITPHLPDAPAAVPAPSETDAEEALLTERSRAQVEQAISAIKDERIKERTRQVLVREAHRREQKQRQGWKECPRCGTLHPESHRLCPLCRLHIRT